MGVVPGASVAVFMVVGGLPVRLCSLRKVGLPRLSGEYIKRIFVLKRWEQCGAPTGLFSSALFPQPFGNSGDPSHDPRTSSRYPGRNTHHP
jgi:hypothetical protein